eukprot:Plantae.Rhodophyta-Hildenbrandia_rubra.ctg6875.p1 GENE.Plantae.Rhodophyta-Hildenbrandia_rubra.ctg6875~~Plantae.Rhodophyta-Hildenbrandia_rubra.ctg6875.p1  ORF type:complete len:742 (+),score=95.42 Plantae.Rhodophyta-Hildenbrandia_rubra.ctg6875:159-2384(+)
MLYDIDGLQVFFPYPSLYSEQRAYMIELKHALEAGGHAVLEMPSGTGKTITLLSLITSFMISRNHEGLKLVYCTRTVEEMQKVMAEMRNLVEARQQQLGIVNELLCVCLASRRHLCVNESIANAEGIDVDSGCRALTASWVREQALGSVRDDRIELCEYFEKYEMQGTDALLKPDVYDLAMLREYGRQKKWCPYFLARHIISLANVVVYSYHYLLDPKVANIVARDLTRDTIVVFDEAHNIDNVCIESLSVDASEKTINAAFQNVNQLNEVIGTTKRVQETRLREEYDRIQSGMSLGDVISSQESQVVGGEEFPAPPVLPDDILKEAVPPEIRNAEQFVRLLRSLVSYCKQRVQTMNVIQEHPGRFVSGLISSCDIQDDRSLRMVSERLTSLLRTLQVASWSRYKPLQTVAELATLLGTYKKGFAIIIEPFDDFTGERAPLLRLACLDASLAVGWVMTKFRTCVITSGTLSPLDTYPRMLNFQAVISASFNMSLDRNCVCPLIMTKGNDQVALSSKYDDRDSTDIPRNYGASLIQFASTVPDGIVVFFPSYIFMQKVVQMWQDHNILPELQSKKVVFVESQDPIEASMAIQNYRLACDSGRGAVLLSVARGRAAEGIDFDGHYGRCVVLFGVPFQYTESRVLKARLEYLRQNYEIREDEFLVFDAMRQAAQCVGRVIRNKSDYGVMVFADKRFSRGILKSKLPKWIGQFMSPETLDLDIGMAVSSARAFLLRMSQQHEIVQ